MVHVGVCNGGLHTPYMYIPYSSLYLQQCTTMNAPSKGAPFGSQIQLRGEGGGGWGVICFWPIQPGGGGGGASNTEYLDFLLEVGGAPFSPKRGRGDLGMPMTYPYFSPYLLLPWCMERGDLDGHICNDDEFIDTLLPEYETYLHGYCLQVELTQITLMYRTL